MTDRTIYITEFDMQRLRKLIENMKMFDYYGRVDVKQLEAELERGHIVTPQDVPPNVITMNSRARLMDLDTGEEMTYTLVFPQDANIREGRISVLAPIGIAMLGYSVGDTFEWTVPEGMRRLKVQEVLYQPEAAGHYHL